MSYRSSNPGWQHVNSLMLLLKIYEYFLNVALTIMFVLLMTKLCLKFILIAFKGIYDIFENSRIFLKYI